MTYTDERGNKLSHEELRKLLKKNSHPQYGWWSHKRKRIVEGGKPPPGVRTGEEISEL